MSARARSISSLVLGALGALPAAAQKAAEGPPLPRATDQPNTILVIAVIVVLVGAAVAVSVMPAKRGHMD